MMKKTGPAETAACHAGRDGIQVKSFCNPLNLEYKFQHFKADYPAHREAADPTLVCYGGRYYLFASMSGGFWHSDNLADWQFCENATDMYLYAPDVAEVNGSLVFSASRMSGPSSIWRSKNPLDDDFEKISAPFAFWDPHTFCDEDGRVYFYWGCSSWAPIYGLEMNPETMMPLGKKQGMFKDRPGLCGWERTAAYRSPPKTLSGKLVAKLLGDAPFVEGAYMTKYKGRYYLQYAAPGTEMLPYGDGVYVADKPLGPYTVQAHNPFSTKPGGFITGAGHGSTLRDKQGNWWHASTMRISVNAKFERRIGLFPAGFDEDGILFCNQNFADYPYVLPEGSFDPFSVGPQWMLLSYQKQAEASSSKEGKGPALGVNESISDWWCAAAQQPGEWYRLDLGRVYDVWAIQLNFADDALPKLPVSPAQMGGESGQTRYIDMDKGLRTRYLLEGSADGESWFVLADKTEAETNLCHDYLLFENGMQLRYVKVTGYEFPYGAAMAISGLRVFGNGDGSLPGKARATAQRLAGGMDAHIRWEAPPEAQGCNVRYGIAPGKLYSSWLVYGAQELALPFLDAEQPAYYVCVDAFNESGITPGDVIEVAGA